MSSARMARERSRSPRRDAHHRAPGALPLADLLLERGILDERSAELLRRAPRRAAEDVLLALGPDVRNPSAFVTRKLAPRHPGGEQQQPPAGAGAPPSLLQAPGGGAAAALAPLLPPQAWAAAPFSCPPPAAGAGEVILVHCNGLARPLLWRSQAGAAAELLAWGVLDEGSADFLAKAPEREAREIVASLGPDVRNPSAFVTRKIRELLREGPPGLDAPPPGMVDTIPFHHNGALLTLQWFSKEQALGDLVRSGVLDEGSADFLMKAPEQEVKDIIASLGPEVRNPSAFVTRKVRELLGGGGPPPQELPRGAGGGGGGGGGGQTLVIHHSGAALALEWHSAEQAIGQLAAWGVLDEGSAEFLGKVPEEVARDIVSSLGPEVRNPSAFVTRKVKAALQSEASPRLAEQASMANFRGAHEAPADEEPYAVTIYHNGARLAVPWHSQLQALEELVAQKILDQRSADFLAKLPEQTARDIVASIGPDVRNPSAFVTKEARKLQS